MHFRCHHLLHQHVLAQGADLRQSCTEAVRMLDNGCRACVPDSGRGLTCVRTQPLAASSMPQEGVPLRLSLGPLDACSREVDLLVVLSSKACHSCSSSCSIWLLHALQSVHCGRYCCISCNQGSCLRGLLTGLLCHGVCLSAWGEGFCSAMPGR